MTEVNPQISIVVRSYNSMSNGKNIARLLESIFECEANVEVVIIDNYSIDSTPNVVKSFPVVFRQLSCNRSEALKLGIQMSKGAYIFMLDADMVLPDGFLQNCQETIRKSNPDGIAVQFEFISSKIGRFDCARYRNLEFVLGAELASGTNILILRKSLLEKVQIPTSVELGEDYIMVQQAMSRATKVARVEGRILHYQDLTSRGVITRALFYGRHFRSLPGQSGTTSRFFASLLPLGLGARSTRVNGLAQLGYAFPGLIMYLGIKYVSFLVGAASSKL